jgi:Flp pilus assembly protein TadD
MRFPIVILALGTVLGASGVSGCNSATRRLPGYETIANDPLRDTDLARRETARGVALLDAGDLAGAEAALKAALAADRTWGPAHNNLGKVYFQQSDRQSNLYLAAREFDFAMKLMPNQPEPPNNLGMVFERVGKLDDAVEQYGKAVAVEPDHVQAIGNLARARIKRGDRDADVRALLGKLVLRDTRPEWLAWARSTLARLEARPTE